MNSKTTSVDSQKIRCNSEKFRETLTKIISEDRVRPDEEKHDIHEMNQKLMKQLGQEGEKVGKPENKRTEKYKTDKYVELNKTIKMMIRKDLRKHREEEVEKILKRNRGLSCLRSQPGKLIITALRDKVSLPSYKVVYELNNVIIIAISKNNSVHSADIHDKLHQKLSVGYNILSLIAECYSPVAYDKIQHHFLLFSMSSRAAKILALAIQDKNYILNFDDDLANASCLETINFFSEIDENLLDNIPIVFQLAHNNDDTNYLLQCDDGGENNLPDSVVERVDIGNIGVRHNFKSSVENIIMIGTNEYSAVNGIGNCGDDESGGGRVEDENQMSNPENTEENCVDAEGNNVDETFKKLKNV
ncbi:hypothetical protein HHI36_006982 [Cryptolaemus montrouzieri]|uniref:Uncharacterized protein n=1 Tax=Cryptolaemus montrouzieri TaxID=559131 RepID=A0ABD2MN78_9CUCU